jgi:hypothetical protein
LFGGLLYLSLQESIVVGWKKMNSGKEDQDVTVVTEESPSLQASAQAETNPIVEHLCREWSLEQDQLLWHHYSQNDSKSTAELALLLGRGL